MTKSLPSQEILCKLLEYNPDTGSLIWKYREDVFFDNSGYGGAAGAAARWNGKNAGKEALIETRNGYRRGRIFGDRYLAHRIIWVMMTGVWPTHLIDHKNGNPSDNRWENLRPATYAQNSWNRESSTSTGSGYRGVLFSEKKGMWVAKISAHLGDFFEKEDAISAYNDAAKKIRGEFHRCEK